MAHQRKRALPFKYLELAAWTLQREVKQVYYKARDGYYLDEREIELLIKCMDALDKHGPSVENYVRSEQKNNTADLSNEKIAQMVEKLTNGYGGKTEPVISDLLINPEEEESDK